MIIEQRVKNKKKKENKYGVYLLESVFLSVSIELNWPIVYVTFFIQNDLPNTLQVCCNELV